MTKEEILEKSREELQGQTISEEDVKIRKEHCMLSENQPRSNRFTGHTSALSSVILFRGRIES
jgi:hypothetical protein